MVKKNNLRKNKIEDLDEDLNEKEEKNKIEWTQEIDKKLIDYYFENIKEDKSNTDEIIDNLINKELKEFNLNISTKDIKHRFHKLKVRKGQKKAMKKFNKIYHIKNTMDLDNDNDSEEHSKTKKKLIQKNKNEDLLPNYIFKLSEKASNNDYKNNLYHCLEFVVEQLESFKKKVDILGENETDTQCELIPTNTNDMNLLKDEDVKNILFSIGFYFNNDTEYITLEKGQIPEIELICQKILNFKNIIDENIELDKSNEIERNQQKENYVKMQKKKHNNSKKLRDYIMTEEEAAKERQKEIEKIEKENNFIGNEDFVIKSKKKKKKLVKKNRGLDLIKEEDEIEEKSKNDSGNKKDIIEDE